jgi:hypothetical protein
MGMGRRWTVAGSVALVELMDLWLFNGLVWLKMRSSARPGRRDHKTFSEEFP